MTTPLVPEATKPGPTRSVLLVVSGLLLIGVMGLLAPKIGPIGVGTLLALAVAVVATRSALNGHRDRRLQ